MALIFLTGQSRVGRCGPELVRGASLSVVEVLEVRFLKAEGGNYYFHAFFRAQKFLSMVSSILEPVSYYKCRQMDNGIYYTSREIGSEEVLEWLTFLQEYGSPAIKAELVPQLQGLFYTAVSAV